MKNKEEKTQRNEMLITIVTSISFAELVNLGMTTTLCYIFMCALLQNNNNNNNNNNNKLIIIKIMMMVTTTTTTMMITIITTAHTYTAAFPQSTLHLLESELAVCPISDALIALERFPYSF